MKNVTILFLALIIFSCDKTKSKDYQIDVAKAEMNVFFQATLMDNYGRKDDVAIKWLLKGLTKYQYNYILNVDRKRIKKLNNRFSNVLRTYIYDYDKMAVKRVMPKSWTQPKLFNPYAPMSITEFKSGVSSHTYWQDEVQGSVNPFFKEITKSHEAIGGYAFSSIASIISYNINENIISISDKETLTFITLCFWEYMCYCANIDFYTGKDKTEELVDTISNNSLNL